MTPAQSFEFSFLFWLRRLWFSSRMVDRPTNRSMINIENDSRYSLAVQYTHYCYLNMFIGLCERTLNERAQATKPTSRWEFIISFTFRAARQNWWSCTSGTEATCVREMKWNEMNWTWLEECHLLGWMYLVHICIHLFPTEWQPNGNGNSNSSNNNHNTHQPSAIALCLHFVMRLILSICNFLLSILWLLLQRVHGECLYRVHVFFPLSYTLNPQTRFVTTLTRHTLTHIRNRPLSLCYMQQPFLLRPCRSLSPFLFEA